MKGQAHRWFQPAQVRERQRGLERQATALIKSADRRRRKTASSFTTAPAPSPELP